MRLIDADAIIEVMKKCAENPKNELALRCYWYTQRILEEAPTVVASSPWHRVEDGLPKKGTYLVAVRWAKDNHFSYEIAHFTDKLEDVFPFEYEAVSGPGWYIWSDYNDDNAQISPEYWMPIEPPKEDA